RLSASRNSLKASPWRSAFALALILACRGAGIVLIRAAKFFAIIVILPFPTLSDGHRRSCLPEVRILRTSGRFLSYCLRQEVSRFGEGQKHTAPDTGYLRVE